MRCAAPLALALTLVAQDAPAVAQAEAQHTNRLAGSSSPYLLQHAHNPVDWYPWGEEAFAKAKAEDKPIFLSVGYSTCYWCHVMEREVFENPEIAALMNRSFVNIKVDREERPDIDEIYMTATQLLTQHGGWPNSVFLTPEGAPFFAGTYFGPEDQPGRPGFPTVIERISQAWSDRRPEVVASSARIAAAVQRVLDEQSSAAAAPEQAAVDAVAASIAAMSDSANGGFGGAPKFPQEVWIGLLLDTAERTGDASMRSAALEALHAMALGGIHDHVGGGFHRYAVDALWRVPHFEKMLYNQAHLAELFVRAWEMTGEAFSADSARDTLLWVTECMTDAEGGFHSALDAETDAVEGAYYSWTPQGLVAVLGRDRAARLAKEVAIAPIPTFPGHAHPEGGVLYLLREPSPETRADLLELRKTRMGRKLPRLDDKVLAAWNGMMIASLARCGAALGEPRFVDAAARAARFALTRMRTKDGGLWRSWRAGVVKQRAFLEDYAFMVRGLIALHTATGEASWLDDAVALMDVADAGFWDTQGGGYFATEADTALLARPKPVHDGAIPSANAVMLEDLVGLWRATHDPRWSRRIDGMLKAFGGGLRDAPRAHGAFAHAVDKWLQASRSEALVAVDARPTALSGGPGIAVTLSIASGWHLCATAGTPDAPLLPVTFAVEGGATLVSTDAPTPITLANAAPGLPARVYEGQSRFTLHLTVPTEAQSSGSTMVSVVARLQACDATTCAAPQEFRRSVRVPLGR